MRGLKRSRAQGPEEVRTGRNSGTDLDCFSQTLGRVDREHENVKPGEMIPQTRKTCSHLLLQLWAGRSAKRGSETQLMQTDVSTG